VKNVSLCIRKPMEKPCAGPRSRGGRSPRKIADSKTRVVNVTAEVLEAGREKGLGNIPLSNYEAAETSWPKEHHFQKRPPQINSRHMKEEGATGRRKKTIQSERDRILLSRFGA